MIGDPERLAEVLCYLLDNTAKFSHGDKPVTIGIGVRDISVEKATLDFYIMDKGIGIPVQYFEKIFEPFFQCDSSNTREYDGTGMGLAMSKRLISLMGGRFEWKAKLGKAVHFYSH